MEKLKLLLEEKQRLKQEVLLNQVSTVIKQDRGKGISSVFSPQIIIKEGDQDGVYFKKVKHLRKFQLLDEEEDLETGKNQKMIYGQMDINIMINTIVQKIHGIVPSIIGIKPMASGSGRSECGNYTDSSRADYNTLRKGADKQYQNSQKQFTQGILINLQAIGMFHKRDHLYVLY